MLWFGFPFYLLALKTVWVASDNNGPKGLCNIERWLLCYFQLPGVGPVQWVNDMSPHGAHRSFLDQFVCPCSLQPFFFSATMMMMVAINAAMVVLRMPILLQMLTPSEGGKTFLSCCFKGWLLDRSFKVSLRNARVFCLNAVVAPTLLPPTVRFFSFSKKYPGTNRHVWNVSFYPNGKYRGSETYVCVIVDDEYASMCVRWLHLFLYIQI